MPPDPLPVAATRHQRWGLWSTIVLFGLSLLFPIVASVLPPGTAPAWLGGVDVACAGLLMLAMLWLLVSSPGPVSRRAMVTSYRIVRAASSLLLLGLVLFFVAGDAIDWSILLPGLAWRGWVFGYSLPVALTLWETSNAP